MDRANDEMTKLGGRKLTQATRPTQTLLLGDGARNETLTGVYYRIECWAAIPGTTKSYSSAAVASRRCTTNEPKWVLWMATRKP